LNFIKILLAGSDGKYARIIAAQRHRIVAVQTKRHESRRSDSDPSVDVFDPDAIVLAR